MINPPTDCFFVIQLHGEAAEYVASTLSESTLSDIREAVMISEDFSNDIAAEVSMDNAVLNVKNSLMGEVEELITMNPLYIPSGPDAIRDVLDGDFKSDTLKFTGMDGNPFTLKTTSLTSNDQGVLEAKVACKPFELPSYEDIIAGQTKGLN